jgi:leucine dehydrogenase
MSVFAHPEFDAHEEVSFFADPKSGLRAIIAIHNTHLGPSLGGCRMRDYPSDVEALTDVLRLSRGMTYKAALADLPQGGGKSVMLGDPRRDKTPERVRSMGRFVECMRGRYLVAEDSGTGLHDMRLMAEETAFVRGLVRERWQAGEGGGDPSPATAHGVRIAVEAAAAAVLQRDSLRGLRVAIQGVGQVGQYLAQELTLLGVHVRVADFDAAAVQRCVERTGATAVTVDDILFEDVDVLCPCAHGAILSEVSIPRIRARVIAGAANNQLATPAADRALLERGICYAPDYVVNAGGIIDIHYQGPGYDPQLVERHLRRIGQTLESIWSQSQQTGMPAGAVADAMAEARFRPHG